MFIYFSFAKFAAGPSTPTCRNCTGGNCANNLLPDLLQQGLLTSGYFNIISSAKPAGIIKDFVLGSMISPQLTYLC